ncbi:Dibenzothiophene desulfurization enzyme B [Rhodovastum atsumiense]|uniref:ABC transporter substrate-binding protein n=1 Tax=Rhodovastum atsumiense TaxID=504468 RepID=A0A5M6J2V8_9PROT|nr:ABC transporter substrate-binding protein [Rhodovastum atsumiense]KAA5614569.1 ABC transporter substrate-binding protein [Rhodovastum atsumiense]CAH2599938.1 Dibenzothiophene desulfurization enzyme B [Rhodovastum atsumiense]
MSDIVLDRDAAIDRSSAPREAYYTICPVYVASNVAAELGWLEDELKRVGAKLSYLRSLADGAGWLPHFSHRHPALFRDGGNVPSIWAHADQARTKLLALTAAHDGGQILVRTDSDIRRVADLAGRRIGLPRSLNERKVDWWRATAERGIELALAVSGLTRSQVEIRDIAWPDDVAPAPARRPSELWGRHDRDALAQNVEVGALFAGEVDAVFAAHGRSTLLERTGRVRVIEDLARHPDWTLQIANSPYALTVSAELAAEAPDIVVAFLRAAVRAGRWINANRSAAAEILARVTYLPDAAGTAAAIAHTDFVPDLSPRNLAAIGIQKQFLRTHGYVHGDFDIAGWADDRFLAEALATA